MQSGFPASPDWAAILGRRGSRRAPITLPQVAGRRIVITGAGGFIGSEMVRVLSASGAESIVLLEIAEQALSEIFSEMTTKSCGGRCVPVLGSVGDRSLLRALFAEHRPDFVLHAAALKHVPLMERNPFAAVATNAVGTWTLVEVAAERGVPRLLLISTDKAVAPRSIMGASKRIAEMAVLARGFTAVRLVNVLGSPGSVGPIFAEQIGRGGPVTVTDRRARRFFLTLQEVAELLAEVIEMQEPAGLFVPDPGEPLLITELAQRMMESAGDAGEPRSIPVDFTGLRPGDKLEEELVGRSERQGEAASLGLRRVNSASPRDLEECLRRLASVLHDRDLEPLLREMESLVPDYEPSALLREAVAAGGVSR